MGLAVDRFGFYKTDINILQDTNFTLKACQEQYESDPVLFKQQIIAFEKSEYDKNLATAKEEAELKLKIKDSNEKIKEEETEISEKDTQIHEVEKENSDKVPLQTVKDASEITKIEDKDNNKEKNLADKNKETNVLGVFKKKKKKKKKKS